jgi:hypothetical protein
MATPTTLPASFTAGQVLTAAQMNNLRGAFRILQVVSANYSTQASTTSATYADTGLTASITPSSTSSKILVIVHQNGVARNGNAGVNLKLFRNTTDLSHIFAFDAGKNVTNGDNYVGTCSTTYLDSPATISATSYKTQFSSSGSTGFVQTGSAASTITLMEISA